MARDPAKPRAKPKPTTEVGERSILVMLESLGWAEQFHQWKNVEILVSCIQRSGYLVVRVDENKYMAVPR